MRWSCIFSSFRCFCTVLLIYYYILSPAASPLSISMYTTMTVRKWIDGIFFFTPSPPGHELNWRVRIP